MTTHPIEGLQLKELTISGVDKDVECLSLLEFYTKYHRLDSSNNENSFLIVLEAGKSRSKV